MLASVATLSLIAAPAGAQSLHRAWVSGHGADAVGCGAPASPCRSLQYVHDHIVAAGGEIDVLDPAGYGAIHITKAISIVNDGVGTAGVQQPNAGQDAITISVGATDGVYLRGLNIDGVGGAASNGVNFVSGARLVVDQCVVRHFNASGVVVQPSAGVSSFGVYDSVLADDQFGFSLNLANPVQVSGVLDNVIADGDAGAGLKLIASSAASGKLIVSNGDASGDGDGIYAQADSASLVLEVNNSTVDNNTHDGLFVVHAAKAHIAGSTINNNVNFGVENSVTGSGATFTGLDNTIRENSAGSLTGPSLVSDTLF